MLLLYPRLSDGLRDLTSILKSKQDSTNKKIGAAAITGGIIALYAAGFFFGPPALAGCFLNRWVTVGAASTALGIGGVLGGGTALGAGVTAVVKHSPEDSRYVRARQPRKTFQNSITKLHFLTAVCWLEKIWHMDFQAIPVARKEEFLRSLGVDPTYFGKSEYGMALIMGSVEQMERDYDSVESDVDELSPA
ncbi:hypothetical protein CC80DRAFT_537966 [Byssothecium circinans]|uniref:Transmembrane protein n=1 Tax=Byssothecium circinans TaxID=147558 RepID=A0A6A5TL72_9PLEO|nr:hypothetical protein CC80DRAFT_537966 [Byssothecium circinans]